VGTSKEFQLGSLTCDRYNPPEVTYQTDRPISLDDLPKCDTWAYGLLVWEILKDGDCYFDRGWVNGHDRLEDSLFEAFDRSELRQYSIRFVNEMCISSPRNIDFDKAALRALFRNAHQMNPADRLSYVTAMSFITTRK
jgi:hypothetical protein